MKKLLSLLAVIAIVIFAAGYFTFSQSHTPAEGAPEFILVPKGASVTRIATQLEQADLIGSATVFRIASRIFGYDKSLRAGKYAVPEAASTLDFLHLLSSGQQYQATLTIPEGATSRFVAGLLARKVNIDSAAFMQVVQDADFVQQLGLPAKTLEGYLYPETYKFDWGITAQEAAKHMVAQHKSVLPDNAAALAKAMGYSQYEMLVLASIVEGEALVDSERVVIAGLYHNRLRKRMRLQADPTIQYIIPDGPRRLLNRDLAIDSPYNTYKYAGLPPGPINNPGINSIRAALQPATVPYIYMVARGDGSHVFTRTLNQHLAAKRDFDRIRREVARRKRMQGK